MKSPNRVELSPLSFLERAVLVYSDQIAIEEAGKKYSWSTFYKRVYQFGNALIDLGINKGDKVAFFSLNSEAFLLAHYAVPLISGVLVSINTKLSTDEVSYIISHSDSKLLFYSNPLKNSVDDTLNVKTFNIDTDLEALINNASFKKINNVHIDENDSISINYTSGTTGNPKGVEYSHRGAYLNALAMALDHKLDRSSRYLWTLPMFHCNGWTFPWAIAAVGATNVCIPNIDTTLIWEYFLNENITHFCAAPTVLNMILNDKNCKKLHNPIRIFTAGSSPSPTLIKKALEYGFELDHVYGLTEIYGPFTHNTICYSSENTINKFDKLSQQGYPNVCAGELRVVDNEMKNVPKNGEIIGEIVTRGNVVMKGYYKDIKATNEAFAGGWFHTGDLAVWHKNGSIEIKDRKKDIIISGGENISSIEIEQAILKHSSVLECAVVAAPHDKWGETPVAVVEIKDDHELTEKALIEHCNNILARFE